MYSYRNDPGADGVGIAFSDAVAPDGGWFDLGADRAPGRNLLSAALGVPILCVRQVHGARAVVVDAATDPQALARTEADALATATRGLGLSIRAADCVPVLLADPDAGVVGAAHAGRVGLAAGVLPRLVATLLEMGAGRLRAWIGPHICGACYEVPEVLQAEFSAAHPAAVSQTSWGTPGLDLGAAAQAELVRLGCAVNRVDPCTFTTPSLHSYRRDGGAAGRQAGVIWLP